MNDPLQGLTSRQAKFVTEYAKDHNGTRSARAAGYNGTDAALAVTANKVLKSVKVSKALEILIAPAVQENQITTERILEKVSKVAFADWNEFVEVKRDKDGEIIYATLKLRDHLTALRMLGEYLRLWGANVDTSLPSQHLHFHFNEKMTPEEARQSIIQYLRTREK